MQVSSSVVQVPSAELLRTVGNHINFLQNYNSAIGQARLPFETFDQLESLSDMLVQEQLDESLSSSLSKALGAKIQSVVLDLKAVCDDAAPLTELAAKVISTG